MFLRSSVAGVSSRDRNISSSRTSKA